MSETTRKIIDNELYFFNVNFSVNLLRQEFSANMAYDERLIKNKKKITKYTDKYLRKIRKLIIRDAKSNK